MSQQNFLESKSKNAETQEEKFTREESALGLSGRYYWMKGWEVAQKFYRVKKILYAKDLVLLSSSVKHPEICWHDMKQRDWGWKH